MTEDYVGVIEIGQVVEHEDGSADFTFHTDDETTKKLAKYGLELVLYCAAYEWDIQDALDSLERQTDGQS
jgi:hypothetical protein